jgi:hypothetical protein
LLMSRPVALICSAISAAERAPCWPRKVHALVTLNALGLKPEF